MQFFSREFYANFMQKLDIPFSSCYISFIMKKNGIKEIAAEAGVSAATVSRVLNNSPRISRDVTQRVLDVARRLEYLPHTQLTRVIALIVSSFNSYESLLISAIQHCAAERKLRLELILPSAPDYWSNRLYIGGISTTSMEIPPSAFPFVVINKAPAQPNGIYSVASDDVAAIAEAVQKFHKAGHSKIGLLLAQYGTNYNNLQRVEGYLSACRANFLNPYKEIISVSEPLVENALKRLLKHGITALIYMVPIEINPQKLFAKLNIRIPKDLSLILWESLGMPSNYRPDYTKVFQNFRELARTSIEMLERLAQKKTLPPQILVPYIWEERNSIRKLAKPR